jgi:hypothetical protein
MNGICPAPQVRPTAHHLIARSVKPGETPNKVEAAVKCQTRFVMHKFGLSFITNIQDNELIDPPQI